MMKRMHADNKKRKHQNNESTKPPKREVRDTFYVPWKNFNEWLEVREKAYSTRIEDLQFAVGRIAAWSAKSGSKIATGATVTSALCRGKIQDMLFSEGVSSYNLTDISLLYGMAIIRFINLVSDLGKTDQKYVMSQVAKSLKIPEWIINLRNDASHKDMPSYDRLKRGAEHALGWLRLNYWERDEHSMGDYGMGKASARSIFSGKDDQIIREHLKDFQTNHFEFIYNKLSNARFQIYFRITQMSYMFQLNSDKFTSILTEPGFLLLRYHHLDVILKSEEKDFLDNESVCLPRSLERFWKPVLEIYNTSAETYNDLILALLRPLPSQNDLEQRVATSWVLHLLEISINSEKNDLKVPAYLHWGELLGAALKNPNKYSPVILKIIGEKVHISAPIKNCLMALVAIKLGSTVDEDLSFKEKKGKKGKKSRVKIYTVEDFKKRLNKRSKVIPESAKGPWKICDDDVKWRDLPLGISPEDLLDKELESDERSSQLKIIEIEGDLDLNNEDGSQSFMGNDDSLKENSEPVYEIDDMDDLETTNDMVLASDSIVLF